MLEEIAMDLIVGQELNGDYLNKIFGTNNIRKYGETEKGTIGETFLICKDPESPNHVWSFILVDVRANWTSYRLIYKYTG